MKTGQCVAVDKLLVSVVIPAYQAEAFLGEAIESALAQTYAPLEVVVADDGSTDRTAEVAASYPEIRLLRLSHRGQAAARNIGVAASEGEMVAFHDADDVMLRDPSKYRWTTSGRTRASRSSSGDRS